MLESGRYDFESLYGAFAGGRRPGGIEACPCCLDEEDIAVLLKTPLRELAAEELSMYASSVFLTVGSGADFVYFLPRILEIRATVSSWWPDPEVVGRSIGNYGWENFSPGQQEALAAYTDAQLREQIGATKCSRLDSWLCFASFFWPRWSDYLEVIRRTPTALIALYEWHSPALQRRDLSNGFWEDSQGKAVLIGWFSSPDVQREILAAYGLKGP